MESLFRGCRTAGLVGLVLWSTLCGNPLPAADHGDRAASGSPEIVQGYYIPVFLNGTQVASITLDVLQKLPVTDIVVPEAKGRQQGPTLLSVLEAAGVKEFSEVTIGGYSKGRISTAEITLKRDQVATAPILDFTRRGTAKLVSPDIPFKDWIVDIDNVSAR